MNLLARYVGEIVEMDHRLIGLPLQWHESRGVEGHMKNVVVGIAAALSFAGTASAGDWRLIYADDHIAIAVEAGSVRRTADTAVGWVAMLYSETEDGVDYSMSRRQFDCSATTVKPLTVVLYTADGQSLGASQSHNQIQAVGPDTIEELGMNAICFDEGMAVTPFESVTELLSTFRETVN